ncbi:hypothetical protein WMY93_022429 [Mugilogobius chulae]|uniref:General transcription factor 3C polypeptide 3 n=1 Tax=Mugilogobius chulae TaxID=88201 RepID=A0AAW0NH50_9GOBI
MSGFSAELIDYLEGRITFEEFDRRRDERKTAGDTQASAAAAPEGGDDEEKPSTSAVGLAEKIEGVSPGVQMAFASILGQTKPENSSENEEEDEDEEEDEEEEGDMLSYVDDVDDEDYQIEEDEEVQGQKGRTEEGAGQKKASGGRKRDRRNKMTEEDDENPTAGDVFALEMELNRESKKLMRERRHRSKLPRALRGLMGEANIRYARGEKNDAILMCMEIIRQAPMAYEPFSTLTMIYEDDGDMQKALQFGLIAAHLNPSDCDEWIRLAEMSLEQDNIRQAIFCYSKAIKYDPTNVRYLWERCNLHMRLGEHRPCMDGYRKILSLLPIEEGEHFMQLSKDMAKSYYESNDLPAALGVIEEALTRHPDLVSDDIVNMAGELYIANHQYNKAVQVLENFSGVEVVRDKPKSDSTVQTGAENEPGTAEGEEKEDKESTEQEPSEGKSTEKYDEIIEVRVPDTVPIDLKAKLIVSLIHLHVFNPLEGLVASLIEQSPEEIGDLYLDYNLAVVWLRHAECLKALGHMETAADSYSRVVEKAPQHLEARLSLATLLQQLGRPKEALKALEPMYDSETLAQDSAAAQKELKLLLHRSTLLKTQGQTEGYLDSMISMISMLLKVAMQRAKVSVRCVNVSGETHLRLVRAQALEPEIADHEAAYLDNTGKTNVLSKEDWWQLLLSCLFTMCEVHRYEETDLLVESAMEFYSFYDNKEKRRELEFIGLSATILDQNHYKAYNYIRVMLMENVNLPQLWNTFNQLTSKALHQRHHRFCLRLLLKNPDNHALSVLCGHNAMVSGSFKHALGQYVQAFQTHPKTPLYSLCLGLTYFHMACQKFVIKRHALVLQGFSFLWRYVELRGECQESMYNIGRALHQMGIEDDQVDLRREISFNLSLIYQASGNMEMAHHLIRTYCIV